MIEIPCRLAERTENGFFVDQRRTVICWKRYAKGRNVLNMFCYTGAFLPCVEANLVHLV